MKLEYSIPNTYDLSLYQRFQIDPRTTLFFDIETTGFSAANTILYLIGACYYDHSQKAFCMVQWFNESGQEEAAILSDFFQFAQSFKTLVHYNGDGFDLRYLAEKAHLFSLSNPLKKMSSFDLYRQFHILKKILVLDHLKQKDLEQFLGVSREDTKSGGELITVYQTFLATPNEELRRLLLLHNQDDIKGLLSLTPLLTYLLFLDNQFDVSHLRVTDSYAVFTLSLLTPLPKRISLGKGNMIVTASKNEATLTVPVYNGELKYFYPDYKNYFYLPLEDTAIHKSVAFYVDKEYRTQAKARNCYSRKNGMFLPQPSPAISPYFKKEYSNKESFFELTDEFCSNPSLLKKYAASILAALQ